MKIKLQICKKAEERFPGVSGLLNDDAMISGGFIRDIIAGDEPNDLDIFIARHWLSRFEAAAIKAGVQYSVINFDQYGANKTSEMYEAPIQLIVLDGILPKHHIGGFSYRCNTVVYDGVDIYEIKHGAVSDCINKSLVVNNAARAGGKKLQSYLDRGWTLQKDPAFEIFESMKPSETIGRPRLF